MGNQDMDLDTAIKLLEQARNENDILRGIAAKIMPCHYCGAEEIGRCPYGFPGCALADDLMQADSTNMYTVREANMAMIRYFNEIKPGTRFSSSIAKYLRNEGFIDNTNTETERFHKLMKVIKELDEKA